MTKYFYYQFTFIASKLSAAERHRNLDKRLAALYIIGISILGVSTSQYGTVAACLTIGYAAKSLLHIVQSLLARGL